MKKVILFTIILALILMAGCQNVTTETPPWTEEQVEEMEDIKTVPLMILKF